MTGSFLLFIVTKRGFCQEEIGRLNKTKAGKFVLSLNSYTILQENIFQSPNRLQYWKINRDAVEPYCDCKFF